MGSEPALARVAFRSLADFLFMPISFVVLAGLTCKKEGLRQFPISPGRTLRQRTLRNRKRGRRLLKQVVRRQSYRAI